MPSRTRTKRTKTAESSPRTRGPDDKQVTLRRSMSIAAAIMMGSVFLSRIMGLVREMVLSRMVGAGSDMDAYVAAFLLPDILNHLLAGGFMSITFIPIFHRHLVANDEERAWRTFSNILTTGTLVLLVLISVSMAFTEEILGLMGARVTDQMALTARMTRIIMPAQFFMYWGSLLMAVQFARKSFFVPALAPLCYNLGIILGGVLLGPWLGIEGFAWGVLGGAFVGNYVLQVVGGVRAGMDFRPVVDLRDRDLRTYVLVSLPLMIGVGMQFSNEALFRIFGSFLTAGSIACLNYATKVLWSLNGLFGQAMGVASYPFLSQLAAENKLDEMNRVAHGVMKRIAVMLLPSAGLLLALAPDVIAVLFQGGSFDAEDAERTAALLSLYLLGTFGFAATAIVSRCFFAMQNTLLPMLLSSAGVALSLPLYWVLARSMGARGVALAGALSMNLIFIAQYTAWTVKRLDLAEVRSLAITVAASLGIAFAAGGSAYGIRRALLGWDALWALGVLPSHLLAGLMAGIPAIAVAAFLLELFGFVPVRRQLADIAQRVRRGNRSRHKR
ncbi:MAG: murein biosynthesis integral membrane protein MurJ [Chitinivibrionales bacterium]|nr:murein biosynthesis integral membrane protein MurJ [Chitinivibrionales bacterium]